MQIRPRYEQLHNQTKPSPSPRMKHRSPKETCDTAAYIHTKEKWGYRVCAQRRKVQCKHTIYAQYYTRGLESMMNRENDRMVNMKISRARGSEQSIQPLENLHCISYSAIPLTGYRICDPATIARGKITDQSDESMRHPSRTSVVL